MWTFASRPSEILTLRFEDFEDNNQKSVLYYANKKKQERGSQLQMIYMNK